MEIKSFTQYYQKQIRLAFVILVSLTILISVLDLLNIDEKNTAILIVNISTIGILLLTFALHFKFRLSLGASVSIAIYVILLNLFLSYYFSHQEEDQLMNYVLRETLFLILMLVFSGLFLHKIHAIVIFLFIMFRYVTLAIHNKPGFLLDNIVVLLLTFFVLTVVVYFLSGRLHHSIVEIQMNQDEITRKNADLSQKNQSLQKMNTAKDQFFSIISHDLKNPLGTLNGFLELMISKANTMDEKKRNFYLVNMKKTVEGITNLLNGLLEWSRSQSGHIEYNPSSFQLQDLASSVCYYLKQVAEAKAIRIENQVYKTHTVYADYNMIFTVIRNLVSNAVKFSPRGGKIRLYAEKRNKEMIFHVVDEGVGMNEETRDKLFRIDESFSSPGTEEEKGTGLGLILCKEFVEKNKGKIAVKSEEGEGSDFYFSLPADHQ